MKYTTTGNLRVVSMSKVRKKNPKYLDNKRNSSQNNELKLKSNALWHCGRKLKTHSR